MLLLRKRPISRQIFMLLLIEVVITLFIVYFSYRFSANMITHEYISYSSQLISQIEVYVGTQCETIQRTMQIIGFNQSTQNFMLETDPIKLMEFMSTERQNLIRTFYTIGEVEDCALVSNNGNRIYLYDNNLAVQSAALPDSHRKFVYSELCRRKESAYGADNFKINMPIYSFRRNSNYGNFIGTLSIVVNAKIFFPLKDKNVDQGGRLIFLADRNGNIFYSNAENTDNYRDMLLLASEDKSGTLQYGSRDYIYTKGDLPYLGGRVYCITPNSELLRSFKDIRFISLCMVLVTMLILAALFLVVYRNITLPVKTFMKFISNVKKNNLFDHKQRINVDGYMEISIMAERFNGMLDEIDKLARELVSTNSRLYEAEISNKEAELALLRSQINPHFLYNTLECMKGIAVSKNVDEIVQMTTSLGRILRYSINRKDITTVKSEVDMIRDYLQIYNVRFPKNLTVHYNIEPEINSVFMPGMTLQPIVENALRHGIEKCHKPGILAICGYRDNDSVLLTICDSGAGINEKQLDMIKKNLDKSTLQMVQVKPDGNIGIANVHRRLALAYGDCYGIKIWSEEGQGTTVLIRIPWRRENDV